MLFNSLHFIWFFAVVYVLYRLLPHRPQNWLLLVSSYYFYASWDWRFLSLLVASTIVDYTCARLIERQTDQRRRRQLLCASIAFNLSLLGFFKYFNFFAENFHAVLAAMGLQADFITVHVLLPVGISFYTFVTMSYVIDVYRREIQASRNFVDFAVFVAYFPHLVAGPILRAATLLPQIAGPRRITVAQVRDGAWLVAWGYFLKIFVADNVAPLANVVFEATDPSGVNVLLGVYAFAFQIYGDFAGYSNIARGTSKLLGIELIENFRFPYLVRSPQEFWRHWHISLSTWLRDYLYIPLGGNRGGEWRTRRNLLATMLLGGLWHGAAWTFVLWGLYQGLLLVAYRAWSSRPAFQRLLLGETPVARALGWFLMFHLTCYGWLIFRAISVEQIASMTAALVFRFEPGTMEVSGLLVPLLLHVTPLLLVHACEAWYNDVLVVRRLPVAVRYSVYAATCYLIVLFGNFGGADFIYFQF